MDVSTRGTRGGSGSARWFIIETREAEIRSLLEISRFRPVIKDGIASETASLSRPVNEKVSV